MKWSRVGKITLVAGSSFIFSLLAIELHATPFSYTGSALQDIEQAPGDLLQGVVVGLFRDFVSAEPQPGLPLPIRLRIPKINVDASIEPVGLTADGAMDTPKDPSDVAWLEIGQRPGEEGSAVIAGHYGRQNGRGSVFDDLHKVRPGDTLIIEDDSGASTSFVVRAMRRYDPASNAAEVFGSIDGKSHLNLITCEGAWDDTLGGYPKRLVVFADKEE